jgi:hypothetical protein
MDRFNNAPTSSLVYTKGPSVMEWHNPPRKPEQSGIRWRYLVVLRAHRQKCGPVEPPAFWPRPLVEPELLPLEPPLPPADMERQL